MDEKVFFDYDGVKVTNARFVVDGQTYAMSNITSVSPHENKPSRVGPIIFIAIGILIAVQEPPLGLIFGLPGVIWWFLQKSSFHILLRTSGGETSALNSNQREYVDKVVAALNDAIIHRG